MPVPGELSDDDVFGASPQAAAPPPSTGQRALANVRSGRPATEGLRGADGTVQQPRELSDEEVFGKPKHGGILANVGAGTSRAVADTLGAPVDALTGIWNRAGQQIGGGYQINNPVGGSEWWKGIEGHLGADPRNVAANTEGERIASAAGEGLAGAVLPWAAARSAGELAGVPGAIQRSFGAGSAAGQAAVGAGAGAAGQAAEDAAPEPYKPIANFAGQLAGGAGTALAHAAGTGLASGARTVLDHAGRPLTEEGRNIAAGQRIATAANDLDAVRQNLADPQAPLVPGSEPTTFQATGDVGLGELERVSAARQSGAYNQRRGEQNAARVSALQGLSPTGDQSHVGPAFRQQLDALNEAADREEHEGRQAVGASLDAAGAPTTPQAAGEAVRGAVAQNWAPRIAAADQAVETGRQGVEQGLQTVGGNPAETSVQAEGARQREALEAARKPVKEQASALYDMVDPDGTLALNVNGVGNTARQILEEVNPRMGGQVAAVESKVLEAAANLRGVELFSDLRNLSSNVGDAMRAIRRDQQLGAESQPFRRMAILRSSIDDAMQEAAQGQAERDAHAVAAGAKAPEDTIQARLSQHAETNGAQPEPPSGRAGAAVSGGDQGPGRAPAVSERAGAQDAGPAGMAGGNRPVAAGPANGARPLDLISFLASKGGIRPHGDLRIMAVGQQRPGLIRKAGMSHDAATDAAIERGYLPPNSSPGDLRAALIDAAEGRKVYTPNDQADMVAGREDARGRGADDAARAQVLMAEEDAGVRLSPDEIEHAMLMVHEGTHPAEAIQRAAAAGDETVLQANAQRNAFSGLGLPGHAAQADNGLAGNGRLAENFDGSAAERLRAANAEYRDYKQTFGQGAVGDVLATGNAPNGYRLGDSQVPSRIFSGGAKGAEAADQLIKAAGSREAALEVLGNYPALSMRMAAERNGAIDLPKFYAWVRANRAVLNKFPELVERLATPAKAQAEAERATQARADLDKQYPIRPGWGDAETMERLVKPGERGRESADALVNEIGQSPRAVEAVKDYMAGKLRDAAVVREGAKAGTVNLAAYQAFMKRWDGFLSHPAFADVRAKFETVAEAQRTLDASTAEHAQAVTAYEKSAARHFLGDDDPAVSMGKVLRAPDAVAQMKQLAQMTAHDPAAQEGLRRAVIEFIQRDLQGNALAGDSETRALKADQFQTFVRKSSGALAQIFSSDQVEMIQNVAADLQRATKSVSGTKLPGGSNTPQDIAASMKHGGERSSLLGLLVMAEAAGDMAAHIAGPIGKIVGMVAVSSLAAARRAGFEKVDDIVAQAMLEPARAKFLLDKYAAYQNRPRAEIAKTFGRRMLALAATAAVPPQ